ncbi:MAG TPA: hypothetical protein VE338_19605 [Ktedonobacterales bacterium]|jgi:hypothetical protein|nr:hypothetical protein [Ktedonobacterales bacterium]
MKPSNPANTSDFEEQTRRLLARYVEDMPSHVMVEAQVRARLAPQTPERHIPPHWNAPRLAPPVAGGWARRAVGLALVILLITAFAAALGMQADARLGVSTMGVPNGSCAEMRSDSTIALCAGSHVQAKIIVGRAYADATRTAVELRIDLTGADLQFGGVGAPIRADGADYSSRMTLQDGQGHIYTANNFTTPINFAHGPYVDVAGDAEFDPLTQAALAAPQTLTLRITQLRLYYFVNQSESVLPLNGPWTSTFQVTPKAERSITFDVAPKTVGGVTVQPLRLDIGGLGSDFDKLGAGERLVLRVSGLSPDLPRSAVAHMSYTFSRGDGSGASANVPTTLLFEGRLPASIAGSDTLAPEFDPVIGPSGSIDLEIIFLTPPLATLSGAQSLTLNQVVISTSPSLRVVNGNWSFNLPLK